MPAIENQITRFPGGVGQYTFFGLGGAAGNITVPGVLASDKLLFVAALSISTTPTSVADLTNQFRVTANNTVNNTGGSSTAGSFVAVTVARTRA